MGWLHSDGPRIQSRILSVSDNDFVWLLSRWKLFRSIVWALFSVDCSRSALIYFPTVLDFMKDIKICKKDLCPLGHGYRRDGSFMKEECQSVSWQVEERVRFLRKGFPEKRALCSSGLRVRPSGLRMKTFTGCLVCIFCLKLFLKCKESYLSLLGLMGKLIQKWLWSLLNLLENKVLVRGRPTVL